MRHHLRVHFHGSATVRIHNRDTKAECYALAEEYQRNPQVKEITYREPLGKPKLLFQSAFPPKFD